jgi:hypothetical protein
MLNEAVAGKTLATTGAAWLCVLLALVLFDYMQNAKLKLGLTQATSFDGGVLAMWPLAEDITSHSLA